MIILKVLRHVMRLAHPIHYYAFITKNFKIMFLPFKIGVIIDHLLIDCMPVITNKCTYK